MTGKLVWQFHTVPHPGEFGYDTWPKDAYKYVGGVNTWGEITVDAKRGIAYFPIGSPTYDYYGADRPGANLFGSSLVALDARTGKRLWHFQMVHHDLWDFDGNAAPQLTTIKRNGKSIDVVALAGKTGFLYVFDRVTGAPIWPIEERPVPKSDMPGEQTWPTQPFPTNPPPFSKQSFTIDDINPHPIVTDAERETVQAAARGDAESGTVYADSFRRHAAHSRQQRRSAVRLHGGGAVERRRLCHQPGQPGDPASVKNSAGRPARRDWRCTSVNARSATGPTAAARRTARRSSTCPGRLDAATVRATIMTGKGRMPAFPHIERRRDGDARRLSRGRRRAAVSADAAAAPAAATFPPGPVVGSGGAQTRAVPAGGRGRGGPRPYPEGVEQTPQYVINAYGTIGVMMKPPFTRLTRYDLNTGTIKWQVGLGDDARLAAHGDHRDRCDPDAEQPHRHRRAA